MNKIKEDIKKRFNEEIAASGMTLTKIAKEVGISQPTMSAYKNSEYFPSLIIFAQICKVIGASADYILGLDEF